MVYSGKLVGYFYSIKGFFSFKSMPRSVAILTTDPAPDGLRIAHFIGAINSNLSPCVNSSLRWSVTVGKPRLFRYDEKESIKAELALSVTCLAWPTVLLEGESMRKKSMSLGR